MGVKRIIISRADSIGDVVLTFPLVHIVKSIFPESVILFLCSSYTKEVLKYHKDISEVIEWDLIKTLEYQEKIKEFEKFQADMIIHAFPEKSIARISKEAGIPIRIGTSHRLYNWLYCNKKVNFSRKRSDLHESQLNIKLLKAIGHKNHYTISALSDIDYLKDIPNTSEFLQSIIDKDKINVIFHPLSKGSAREWRPHKYIELANMLSENKYNIIFTGTKVEGDIFAQYLNKISRSYHNLAGKCSLGELIQIINSADALVASSTGPLHLAAIMGKVAIGIYPPIRPMHPGRWSPIGKNVHLLCAEKTCNSCRKTTYCHCVNLLEPKQVEEILENVFINKITS